MPKFEERLASLEQVVERLEKGDLSLDESVRLFEEGIGFSNACKAELERAEGRIQILVETHAGLQPAELELDEGDVMEDLADPLDEELDEE